jgi:cobalt-zinc-cadmium efflux system outer membrane protein
MTQYLPRLARQRPLRAMLVALVVTSVTATSATAQAGDPSRSPLTLRALLDSVLANHPSVRAAESRVRAAEGSRVTAGVFGNPILSYQVDQTPFPGGRPLTAMDREAMTTATLPLEPLYQRGPRVTRANADVRAAQADARGAKQRIGLDAVAAYYRTAIAQVQVATTADLVNWLDTLVAYNRSRVEEGVAAEADLIRSELERDRMSAEAAMQRADLAQARAALGSFLSDGQTPRQPRLVAIDDIPFALPALARSIDARPDVQAARERVAASAAGITAERLMVVRQVGATFGALQTAGTTSMIAGISLPVPLFDSNRGEVQRASAERDAARFDLAQEQRTAGAELTGAYEAAQILTERATSMVRRDSVSLLSRAEESRRIALGAYREGAVPLFQVIDAARAWADARVTYYRTVFAQHQSVLTLVVAAGSDLFMAVPATPSSREDGR